MKIKKPITIWTIIEIIGGAFRDLFEIADAILMYHFLIRLVLIGMVFELLAFGFGAIYPLADVPALYFWFGAASIILATIYPWANILLHFKAFSRDPDKTKLDSGECSDL